jgi:predicted secreted Zn-dependent protease
MAQFVLSVRAMPTQRTSSSLGRLPRWAVAAVLAVLAGGCGAESDTALLAGEWLASDHDGTHRLILTDDSRFAMVSFGVDGERSQGVGTYMAANGWLALDGAFGAAGSRGVVRTRYALDGDQLGVDVLFPAAGDASGHYEGTFAAAAFDANGAVVAELHRVARVDPSMPVARAMPTQWVPGAPVTSAALQSGVGGSGVDLCRAGVSSVLEQVGDHPVLGLVYSRSGPESAAAPHPAPAVEQWKTGEQLLDEVRAGCTHGSLWAKVELSDQVFVTRRTLRYPIAGTTRVALRQELASAGPVDDGGQRVHGYTRWTVHWSYALRTDADGCRASRVNAAVDLVTILPRLVGDAPQPVRSAWSEYIARLGVHEDGHAEIGLEAARALRRALEDIEVGNCDDFAARANRAANEVFARQRAREQAYDRDTGHGSTQGVRL